MKKKSSDSIFLKFIALMIIGSLVYSCDRGFSETRENPENKVVLDSLNHSEKEEIEVTEKEPEWEITYHLDSVATRADLDSFQTRYSEGQKKIIFALNRIDPERLTPGSQLIIPDSLVPDLLAYTPFPEDLSVFQSIPKTVLISRRIQGFALYEQGRLIRWGPVSSGKESTPTPKGLHYGNHKSKKKVSTVNPKWLLPYYFNFMNFEGVGVHQYSMPGYPASHACVRLLEEDASFIYDWAEQWKLNANEQVIIKNGTPFMVYGDYDFTNPGPWLRLAENNRDNELTAEELDTLQSYANMYFKDERNFERSVEETGLPSVTGKNLPPAKN